LLLLWLPLLCRGLLNSCQWWLLRPLLRWLHLLLQLQTLLWLLPWLLLLWLLPWLLLPGPRRRHVAVVLPKRSAGWSCHGLLLLLLLLKLCCLRPCCLLLGLPLLLLVLLLILLLHWRVLCPAILLPCVACSCQWWHLLLGFLCCVLLHSAVKFIPVLQQHRQAAAAQQASGTNHRRLSVL
jgi:hypothetical protein